MKHLNSSIFGTMLLMLMLSACASTSPGPQAWLDHPLDGMHAPLAALTIHAHASDEDGVVRFEFFANDAPLLSVDSNGKRLSEALVEWTPPGPGIYVIRVHAIDAAGNTGSDVSAVVTIGAEMVITVTPTDTPDPGAAQTKPPASLPPQTEPPAPLPPQTEPPAPPPPQTEPPAPPPPAVDTTAPIFYYADASPDEILIAGNGCPSYERIVTVTAEVGDEGGMGNVLAHWNIDGTESGQVTLSEAGSGYSGTIGPVNTVGVMQISLIANDVSGNSAQSGTVIVTVKNCIN